MGKPTTIEQATDAYEAYAATQRIICEAPELLENEYFIALQQAAYARFMVVYNALEPAA